MRNYFRVMQDGFNDMEFRTIQNAREDVIGELDAIIQYSNHIRSTDNLAAQVTTRNILHEEMVHVGELMSLLFRLDPEFKKYFDEGVKEFNENLTKNN